ncbi:MAG: methylenetetrahydrofolate reductase C-terminal domain-containing protein [Candidatus Bathyarchaeota archaeon]|nr:methylenetetrahydrofolate reductase C-terminal domain-containing protein [Candidatus Bathyarchaeota archaeon]
MIVTKEKPVEEILEYLAPYKNVLVLGCDGCTQPPRGLKQAKMYAMLIEMAAKLRHKDIKCRAATVAMQCDNYLCSSTVHPQLEGVDAVLSLACGIGVQTFAEVFPDVPVYPGQDTVFAGSQERENGKLYERCKACGDCLLGETGGICPVTACAKGLMNGPCGGCVEGKCEVPYEIRDEKGEVIKMIERDCAWCRIYERLKKLGRLDLYRKYRSPRDRAVSAWPRLLEGV